MKHSILKLGACALVFFAFSSIQAQEKKEPNFDKMLERFDADKNGTISLEEFKSAKRKNEVPEERLEKNFAHLDSDSNGEVTLEELQTNWGKGKEKGKKKKQ
ncbi:EF-hand domain-containing protein [Tamlana fucoidanivorans]|uniref:EF-hand domain-containing protein n=1 Tax=Allotamlana fucoidanivorans TaxID=2583814 RepID=A0A5C4SKU2_9FLAO|nr:EF-hand domain-containing protein [Tamlana fucoidanivorans]TNJ44540.1 EF-hand domain-containing protein [Tamlana fucoidanivorans]